MNQPRKFEIMEYGGGFTVTDWTGPHAGFSTKFFKVVDVSYFEENKPRMHESASAYYERVIVPVMGEK